VKEYVHQNFEFICNNIITRVDERLKAHALLLRSGAAFFTASDTITAEKWRIFIENEKLDRNLPGIQGVGYSLIIPYSELPNHIKSFRQNGFPDYDVRPSGKRDIYTPIIFLEPFTGRNLRAFGFDMFSESVRREAMEIARDSDIAMLSGKVILVQETEEDIQSGALMYVPVYNNEMTAGTVEERRAAIKGWVYSPYRMNDLMKGILGNWDSPFENRIHLEIFDNEDFLPDRLLYDSQADETKNEDVKDNLRLTLPLVYNGKKWALRFSGYNENLSFLHGETVIVLLSGISISILLFLLTMGLIWSGIRNQQIHFLNDKLRKINSDKDRFISILGHDLRNPFNVLLGMSEILKNEAGRLPVEELGKYVDLLHDSAHNTYVLLEDLLLWARAQQDKVSFNRRELNFDEIIFELNTLLKPMADSKNITIEHSIMKNSKVFADIDMLKTILRNLVSNAIKYTHQGGQIVISLEQDMHSSIITISDNGIGMNPADLKKLFDISQVFTTKGTADEKGSGLGLLLCKEFVDKHGGSIRAESEPSKGSSFIFTLPG
jgi:signal transduction histidine kinase